jgi:stabilization protein
MDVPILSGIYTDQSSDFRTRYPRNLIPVPLAQGISNGYLRPADGLVQFAALPGVDRGGINWSGVLYRVAGTKLVSIDSAGIVTTLGDVGSGGQVTLDYSFDRLAIASGGHLYYWNGASLTQVTDPDLGNVVDMLWVDGYFMTTDGVNLVVTELNDPTSVNPLKYGSSEADPDPVVGLIKLRSEVYALNRYTIEVFDNVGGDNFPFAPIPGAQTPRGCIGTFAADAFLGSIAFLGSGRREAPAVWLLQNGDTLKLSTRQIDQVLLDYTEAQLAAVILESRVDKGHQHLLVHLPDQVLVYDGAASLVVGQPIWFTLTTSVVGTGTYRARNLVWVYDQWIAGDPTAAFASALSSTVSSHYGAVNGWDFGTSILYNEGKGAIVHALELIGLTGRAQLGADPTIWTSYSLDGETWSQERPISAGKQGERAKRLQWRTQGKMRNWRMQQFRGTSDAHASFARIELTVEPLNG